jgi:hypothetical protein
MKKLVKILGIMTAALLVGGMIIGCTHADLGYDISRAPDHTAPALVAGGGNGGNTSVPQEFKDMLLADYAEDPEDFAMEVANLGIANLSTNPNDWTDAQWTQVYEEVNEGEK